MFSDRQSPRRRLAHLTAYAAGIALVGVLGINTPVAAQGAARDRLTQPVYRVPSKPVAQPATAAPQISQPQPVTPALATRPVAVAQPAMGGRPPVVQAVATTSGDPFAGVRPEHAGLALIDTRVTPASATAAAPPFDLTQQPGEHPLAPCLRVSKQALAILDQQITDYSATFTKVERLNGRLADPQQIQIRVRHRPFSVYLKFVQPNAGQEVLYVENQNNGKLVALASGWKRRLGKLNLDPTGATAMNGQRHPITKAGIRNLTAELVRISESDVRYAECDVNVNHNVKIDGRPASMIESIHPVPRKNFKFHKSRIFFDHELQTPVAFEAYSWPATPGGAAVLEERYIYTDIRVNNGFTDMDFNAENPALFN